MNAGEQGADVGDAQPEAVLEEASPASLDDHFAQWFARFNAGQLSMQPGHISWKQADDVFAEHPDTAAHAGMLLSEVRCWTRHMHARPTPLPFDWLSSGAYVIDTENFRARPDQIAGGDLASNWFAVEVPLEELKAVIAAWLSTADPSEAEPAAERGDAEPATPSAESPGRLLISEAGLIRPAELAERIQTELGQTLPVGSTEDCPPGYRVVATPEGFVGVWYGPVRRTEAAAVADTWRQEKRTS